MGKAYGEDIARKLNAHEDPMKTDEQNQADHDAKVEKLQEAVKQGIPAHGGIISVDRAEEEQYVYTAAFMVCVEQGALIWGRSTLQHFMPIFHDDGLRMFNVGLKVAIQTRLCDVISEDLVLFVEHLIAMEGGRITTVPSPDYKTEYIELFGFLSEYIELEQMRREGLVTFTGVVSFTGHIRGQMRVTTTAKGAKLDREIQAAQLTGYKGGASIIEP